MLGFGAIHGNGDTRIRKSRDEVAVGARSLFGPGAHVDISPQSADLIDCEPAAHRVLLVRQTHAGERHRIAHTPDPVGALTEALRLAHEVIIGAGGKTGLLIGLTHGSQQQITVIAVLGMALGEAPDGRCATAEQEESQRAIAAHQDNTSAAAAGGRRESVRDNRHFYRSLVSLSCATAGIEVLPVPPSTFCKAVRPAYAHGRKPTAEASDVRQFEAAQHNGTEIAATNRNMADRRQCPGRKCGNTFQPHPFSAKRYLEAQCPRFCEDGSELCKLCGKIETKYMAGENKGTWHGIMGGVIPSKSHIAGGNWAAAENAKNAARLAKEAKVAANAAGGGAAAAPAKRAATAAEKEAKKAEAAVVKAAKEAEAVLKKAAAVQAKAEREATAALKKGEREAAAAERRAATEAKKAAAATRKATTGRRRKTVRRRSTSSSSSGSSSSSSGSSSSSSSNSSRSSSSTRRNRNNRGRFTSRSSNSRKLYRPASANSNAGRPAPRFSEAWGGSPSSNKQEPMVRFEPVAPNLV
jgi:hypothetical protein